MKIRQAERSDIYAIKELFDQGERAFAGEPDIFLSGGFADVCGYLDAGQTLVAEDDGKITGMVSVGVFDVGTSKRWNIAALVVDSAARGSGVGGALLAEAHMMAKTLGATRGLLLVSDGKSLAPFYERNGYRVIGHLMESYDA